MSVAPWVVRQVPSLFALSERVLLGGYWEHGFFSLTAVGAYNVGSIEVDMDKVSITTPTRTHARKHTHTHTHTHTPKQTIYTESVNVDIF